MGSLKRRVPVAGGLLVVLWLASAAGEGRAQAVKG
jgi:hypothetical protein